MSPNRVLIVDDSKDVVRVLQAAFVTLDASLLVSSVSTAEEALLDVIRNPVHLMVIDVRLPGISGLDLTRKLRTSSRAIKIIQISGINDEDLPDRAREAGADAFIRKPVSVNELLSTARPLLGMAKLEPVNEKIEAPPPIAAEKNPLVKLLGDMRRHLGAEVAALMDKEGQWIAQAGKFPDPALATSLAPGVLASLGAIEKTSHSLGAPIPESVVACKGQEFDILIASAGYGFAAVLILPGSKSGVRLAIAQDELFAVQDDLRKTLVELGFDLKLKSEAVSTPVKNQPAAKPSPTTPSQPASKTPKPPPAPVSGTGKQELESLVHQPSRVRLSVDELNAFWSAAAEQNEGLSLSNPDVITYEQAIKMGLTPGNGKPEGDEEAPPKP